MPLRPIPNEKTPAVTTCEGLRFVWTTKTSTKGQDDDDIHIRRNQT